MAAMPTETNRRRVGVVLDPEVLIEALILKRLAALAKRRQQEWLRTLLVQGFVAESRLLRQLQADLSGQAAEGHRPRVAARSGFVFGDAVVRPIQAAHRAAIWHDAHVHAPQDTAERNDPHKPFAHLRKVVG